MDDSQQPQDPRQSANRTVGLSCYAAGACMIGVIALVIYDDGFSDLTSLALMAAAALVLIGLGYSTGRRR